MYCIRPLALSKGKYCINFVVFISLYLASCASWQITTDAWEGRNIDDLILSWGPPESVHELSDGRKTVLFRHSRMNQGTELYCNVTFNTDIDGIITKSTVDGNIGGCNRFFGSKGPP